MANGGKFVWKDDQETPNSQQAGFVYGEHQISFDTRNLPSHTESAIPMGGGSMTGNIFYGAAGHMIVHPEGYQVLIGDEREKTHAQKQQEERRWDPVPHMSNFIDAVRSRNPQDLNADVAIGVEAAALCHYANASCRTGRRLTIDSRGMAAGDSEANRILRRDGRAPYSIPELG